MVITECKSNKSKIDKHTLIPNVIDHIFTICKEDKRFSISKSVSEIDVKITNAKQQILKQQRLINQSNDIKKGLLEKIKTIDDESFKIKYKVLETLGSDI
jgi:hypothetical protein